MNFIFRSKFCDELLKGIGLCDYGEKTQVVRLGEIKPCTWRGINRMMHEPESHRRTSGGYETWFKQLSFKRVHFPPLSLCSLSILYIYISYISYISGFYLHLTQVSLDITVSRFLASSYFLALILHTPHLTFLPERESKYLFYLFSIDKPMPGSLSYYANMTSVKSFEGVGVLVNASASWGQCMNYEKFFSEILNHDSPPPISCVILA